jgi:hypothetical protein
MKKLIAILVPMLLVSWLAAFTFDFDGENRTRAWMYNDATEKDGGRIDNRSRIGLTGELYDGLAMRANLEIGDIVWGGFGGGISTGAMNVETYELYIDYRVQAIGANVRFGQQYWADHRGLILDDTFSGVLVTKDDFFGFQAEAAWMKVTEGMWNTNDDNNVFMAHLASPNPIPWGAYIWWGYDNNTDTGNATLMPYFMFDVDPVQLDITPFADFQMMPGDDQLGFGAAAKVTADLGMFNAGADVLFAGENGLSTLSPYYQNGLYIYGYGDFNDGTNLYWGGGYTGNADTFLSAVGFFNAPIGNRMTAFAHAGTVLDTGVEFNAGVSYDVIPDVMTVAGFGAYGMHDNDTNNYLFGTTVKIAVPE